MKTLIYAHRGASKLAPENTLPAFQLAYQMGADGIETDIQLTKDNIPILIHDEKLQRTTNGIGFVQNYTYHELQNLDAGSWFSEKYVGTKILSLTDFLEWIKDKPLQLNIELKNNIIDYAHLESIVYQMLVSFGVLKRSLISSFNPISIERFSKIDPNVPTGFLTSRKKKYMISFLKQIGASAVHIKYRQVNTDFVEYCHSHQINVRTYTVNKPSNIMRAYHYGCDAIFTDVPHIALEYRKLYMDKHENFQQ